MQLPLVSAAGVRSVLRLVAVPAATSLGSPPPPIAIRALRRDMWKKPPERLSHSQVPAQRILAAFGLSGPLWAPSAPADLSDRRLPHGNSGRC